MLDPLNRFPEFRAVPNRTRTPITLIGGFLGAGKTTLLNSLLHQAAGRRFAVLVNDFGTLNIDAKLVVNVDGPTMELSDGCICCTLNDDLVAGVTTLLQRPEPPEHILIETSGVSDPFNILFALVSSELRDCAWIDNVITVVDALHAAEARHADYWSLFERQIGAAYTVVLNKTALAGPDRCVWVRNFILECMPSASIIETADGAVPLPLLLDEGRSQSAAFRPMPVPSDDMHPFTSVAWRSTVPLCRERFGRLLRELQGAAFRAKGLIQFAGKPTATLFQMVGNLQSFADGPSWSPSERCTEIVFIGSPERLKREALLAALTCCEITAPPA